MPGLLATRLRHQALTASPHSTAREVVAWLGAVQAQDYPGAAWALALRARGLTLAEVDRALAEGAIIRTHVLRPTWHFVTPRDLRWMLALTGPRVKALMQSSDARLELDARTLTRARTAIERALEGQRHLTRPELAAALSRAKIAAAGQRLAHIVMDVELAGVICSGPRRGAQFTYALVDERVPAQAPLSRDEALAALATRYFRSHGPATIHDFAWWSGLTVADSRQAVTLAECEDAVLPEPPAADRVTGAHFLLPNYDECLIAYRHRGASLDPERARNFGVLTTAEYPHQILLHGRVAGSWRREVSATAAQITLKTYAPLAASEAKALARQAARLGRFLGVPCTVRH